MTKWTIILIVAAAVIVGCPACGGGSAPTTQTFAIPPVAATTVPLQATGWEGATIHLVCLTVTQSYEPDKKKYYSDYVAGTAQRILARLGVEVVETSPCDASLVIDIKGQGIAAYYGPQQAAMHGIVNDDTVFAALGASAHAEVTVTAEGHEPATGSSYYETGLPGSIKTEGNTDIIKIPMNKAVGPAFIEALVKLWGGQVFVKALEDEDESVRYAATKAVWWTYLSDSVAVPEGVAPALAEALSDESEVVSSGAAFALNSLGARAKDAVPALMELFIQRTIQCIQEDLIADYAVRGRAEDALCAIGAAAVPDLITALRHESRWVRAEAARALKRIGPPASEAVPALAQALQDEDWYVRGTAADSLAGMGPASEAAVPALVQALQDGDAYAWGYAASTLAHIGPAAMQAVPALIKSLGNEQTKVAAAAALKSITGQDFGNDASGWQQWWDQQQQGS